MRRLPLALMAAAIVIAAGAGMAVGFGLVAGRFNREGQVA